MKNIKHIGLALVIATALATTAKANLDIQYSVDGTAPIAIGSLDTVQLSAYSSGSPGLSVPTDGTPVMGELNGVTWNYNAASTIGTGTASRDITITLAVGSQTLVQSVLLTVTKLGSGSASDLNIEFGAPVVFSFTQGAVAYDLLITPDATSLGPVSGSGMTSGTIDGTFQLIGTPAVPEPTTMLSAALLALPFGASTLRILRKKCIA